MRCVACGWQNLSSISRCASCGGSLTSIPLPTPSIGVQAALGVSPTEGLFVGRGRELAELLTGLEDMIAGRGRLFLLAGEPGIGKTRTADEVAAHAASRGVRVLWGRAWEGGGAPAYWPWVQVLRACLGGLEGERPNDLGKASAPGLGDEITQIIPELRGSLPKTDDSSLPVPDLEQIRFRLFDGVTTLLKRVSTEQPLMIVLDDLHDAQEPSLLMLRFLSRELRNSRLLVLGTYRELEVRRSPALAGLIGGIVREGRQIPLGGLSQPEVGRLLESSAGHPVGAKLVADIYQATGGNPLFVDGVIRVVSAEEKMAQAEQLGSLSLAIPEGIREVIRRRLTMLSPQASSVLRIAAIVGNEFDETLLERLVEVTAIELLGLMDEAVDAAILRQSAAGQYRFSHALIREALYAEVGAADRLRRHRQIAEVFEEFYRQNLEPHLGVLAYHFCQAVESGDAGKAIDYSVQAGDAAYRVFAYETADSHWQRALDLTERYGGGDEGRARLLERLADLMNITGSDHARQIDYWEKALALYDTVGRADRAARIHSRLGIALSVLTPMRALEHYRKAEAVLGQERESPSLALAYLGRAMAAERSLRTEEGLSASRRAMEIGERLNNVALWARSAAVHGLHLLAKGRLSEAFTLLDDARSKAHLSDDTMANSTTAWVGGFCRNMLWDPLDAEDWYLAELAKPQMAQAPRRRQILFQLLGTTRVFEGNLPEARRLLSEAPSRLLSGEIPFFPRRMGTSGRALEAGLGTVSSRRQS